MGESMPPLECRRSPLQAISPTPVSRTTPKKPSSSGPMVDSENECTDWMTPDRVRKVPRMVRLKVATTNVRFQIRSSPRRCCTITEWRYAVPTNQGRKEAFSTGSHPQNPPHPSTWYDHHAPSRMPTLRNVQAKSVHRRVSVCQSSSSLPVANEAMAKANG